MNTEILIKLAEQLKAVDAIESVTYSDVKWEHEKSIKEVISEVIDPYSLTTKNMVAEAFENFVYGPYIAYKDYIHHKRELIGKTIPNELGSIISFNKLRLGTINNMIHLIENDISLIFEVLMDTNKAINKLYREIKRTLTPPMDANNVITDHLFYEKLSLKEKKSIGEKLTKLIVNIAEGVINSPVYS